MKRINFILVILAIFTFVPKIVFAQDSYVAEVNGKKYTTISSAMSAAEGTSNEVKLLSNVTLTETKVVNKALTINLNGYNIYKDSLLFEVKGAKFTLTGTGSLEETSPDYTPIAVYGSEKSTANYTIVNIGENVTLKGWSGIMIRQLSAYSLEKYTTNVAYGIVVNFDGKIESVTDRQNKVGHGIYVNGNIQHEDNAPIINIGNKATINSLGIGISSAGYSVWNIDGVKINAASAGVAIKSGEINIKNSEIIATDKDNTPVEGNNNGFNETGAAIQIESNLVSASNKSGYYGNIKLNLENNKIISEQGIAYYEYTTDKTPNTEVKSVVIKNTEFISAEGKDTFVVSDSYKEKYTKNITVKSVSNGEISVDRTIALVGEKITILATINDGYELKEINVVDANNNTIALVDNSFNMPQTNVEISAEIIKIEATASVPTIDTSKKVENIEIGIKDTKEIQNILLETLKQDEDLVSKAESTAIEVELNINSINIDEIDKDILNKVKETAGNKILSDFFDISILVVETVSRKEITEITELTKEIELTILLPESLKNTNDKMQREYYVIREHEGQTKILDAKISEDGNYLTFKTANFSTYALAYEDNVKTNPKTGDKLLTNILISGISMMGIIGAVYYIKKKNLFN